MLVKASPMSVDLSDKKFRNLLNKVLNLSFNRKKTKAGKLDACGYYISEFRGY